jgi:hypothetical protein
MFITNFQLRPEFFFIWINLPAVNGVSLVPRHGRVVRLPAAGGEDVLVPLVPAAVHDLARVRLVLLHADVVHHPDVLVHVEVEERTRLAPGLGDDEVVEGDVVRDDEVLLHVAQAVAAQPAHLAEVGRQLRLHQLQEAAHGRALGDLHGPPVPRAVPVTVHDLHHLQHQ